jgi:signal transduction histidine kinase
VQRSQQTISVLLTSADGRKLGTLELSNGPNYGAGVIGLVSQAWIVSGAVAILVAALAGWFASQRVTRPVLALEQATRQMQQGDLRVRVDFRREQQQEFVSLAHSFNGMAEQVEQTIFTLRRFVADAAHELNTPLTALQTNIELAVGADDTLRGEVLAQAQAQIDRLRGLVSGLLSLSRVEGQRSSLQLEPLDLAMLARSLGEQYASRAEQAGIGFELDMPANRLVTRGDATQLRRALENLLDNAVKFTPSGGQVSLHLEATPQKIIVSVADAGIGIPPDDLPLLFHRFHRGSNVTNYPGNGLGLAIVQAIAQAHGGSVTAASTDAGTCFVISLPAYPDP